MIDEPAYAHEIAALLIADIRTSGAGSETEIREAFRMSLRSLLGDVELPAQFAFVLPVGAERWPTIIVTRSE